MRRITIMFFAVPCLFLFADCGLESFYFLDAPVTDGHSYPTYDSSDPLSFCFRFMTAEQSENNSQYIGSGAEFSFKGTEVYYKIYNNFNTMKSNENTIDNLNTSSTASVSAAADRLLGSFRYQPLCFTGGSDVVSETPFVAASGTDRYVYIKLNDYGSSDDYKSSICIGDHSFDSFESASSVMEKGIAVRPVRKLDKPYGFNFNADDEDNNPLPVKDDPDVNLSETPSEEGKWYVDMYAFSYGSDTTPTPSYSRVLFLGSITITESDYNN